MKINTTLLVSLIALSFELLLAAPAMAQGPAANGERSAPEDLTRVLEPLRTRHEVPALAALIIRGDETVAVAAVGLRRADGDVVVTLDDRWHLGSCTKSMTATLVARLVEQGKLSWTTTIGETFPDIEMDEAWRPVTLELLLTNRSGAASNVDQQLWRRLWGRQGTPVQQRRRLVEAMLMAPPEAPPGTKYIYSNAGYAIAGAIAETTTGVPWEELIRQELFEPLRMRSAGFGAPGVPGRVDEPFGHMAGDGTLRVRELGPGDDNPPAIAPAGLVHCSMQDWSRYVAAHLAGARGQGGLVTAETFDRLHTPTPGGYAMGWDVRERAWAGGRVIWHNGSNGMWYCEVAIVPDRDLAILVAMNRGDQRARRASSEILRALFDHATAEAAPRAPSIIGW